MLEPYSIFIIAANPARGLRDGKAIFAALN
jgi:hypothetical protein